MTPGPRDVACVSMSEADGLKNKEETQTLTPQLVNIKNSLPASKVKVSQTAS